MVEVHGKVCPVCLGHERVARLRECGSKVDVVSCPLCVRGLMVLGPHELLRPDTPNPSEWKIWRPGDVLDTKD